MVLIPAPEVESRQLAVDGYTALALLILWANWGQRQSVGAQALSWPVSLKLLDCESLFLIYLGRDGIIKTTTLNSRHSGCELGVLGNLEMFMYPRSSSI